MCVHVCVQVLDDAEEIEILKGRMEKQFKAKQVFHVYFINLINLCFIITGRRPSEVTSAA